MCRKWKDQAGSIEAVSWARQWSTAVTGFNDSNQLLDEQLSSPASISSVANGALLQASRTQPLHSHPDVEETKRHVSYIENRTINQILTVQMFLFGPHYFMRGRLAHRLGYGRAGDAVLGGGDPVCDTLSRHSAAHRNRHRYTNHRNRVSLTVNVQKLWATWQDWKQQRDKNETTDTGSTGN